MSMLVDSYRFGTAGGDPYFSSVVSLNHFDGPGSTTFVDVIPARTWTRTGTLVVISNTQSMFGGYSLSTSATSGNYLLSDSSADFAFGTADFTIEYWHRTPSSFPSSYFLTDWRDAGNQAKPLIFYSSGNLRYYVLGAIRITSSVAVSTSTWYHIAISRVSGTTRMFVNGADAGSWADATNYITSRCAINTPGDTLSAGGVAGFIDEFRVTKGVGRYSSAFTPAGPFPNS